MNERISSSRVLHVITGLNNGGAEAVLYRLCTNDNARKHVVISMMGLGKYGPLLLKNGIEVHTLDMPQGKVTIKGLFRLYRLVKEQEPDVVQTWMYHADLIGGIVAKIAGIKNVFWNIRQTSLEKGLTSRATVYVAKACALISRFIPTKIICCARRAAEYHADLGYDSDKMVVIGNGYELDSLAVKPELRVAIRNELLLKQDELVLGMVGRFDPAKDHYNLLKALSHVKGNGVNFKCLLVGKLLSHTNSRLLRMIEDLGLLDHIVLMEQRTDIPAIMNAMDIHILSSYSEAFPNVLAEAMACGTPCVSTDVGDAALIIDETGWIVPPGDAKALAAGIESAVDEYKYPQKWVARKESARCRVVGNYSVEKMIKNYEAAWSLK